MYVPTLTYLLISIQKIKFSSILQNENQNAVQFELTVFLNTL